MPLQRNQKILPVYGGDANKFWMQVTDRWRRRRKWTLCWTRYPRAASTGLLFCGL